MEREGKGRKRVTPSELEIGMLVLDYYNYNSFFGSLCFYLHGWKDREIIISKTKCSDLCFCQGRSSW